MEFYDFLQETNLDHSNFKELTSPDDAKNFNKCQKIDLSHLPRDAQSVPEVSRQVQTKLTPQYISVMLNDAKNKLKQKQYQEYEQSRQKLRNLLNQVTFSHFSELERIRKPHVSIELTLHYLLGLHSIIILRQAPVQRNPSENKQWDVLLKLLRKKPRLFMEIKDFVKKIENEDFDMDQMTLISDNALNSKDIIQKDKSILSQIVCLTASVFDLQQTILGQSQKNGTSYFEIMRKASGNKPRFIVKKEKTTDFKANNQQGITESELRAEKEEEFYEFNKEKPKIEINQQEKVILIDLSQKKPMTTADCKQNKSYELSIAYARHQGGNMKLLNMRGSQEQDNGKNEDQIEMKHQLKLLHQRINLSLDSTQTSKKTFITRNNISHSERKSSHKRTRSLGSYSDFINLHNQQRPNKRKNHFSIRLNDLNTNDHQTTQPYDVLNQTNLTNKSQELDRMREDLIQKLSRTIVQERKLIDKIQLKINQSK